MEKLNERQYPTYGSISVLNVAEMGTFDKATVSKARLCGWQNLLAMVIAIITSLFLGASLSWYFTQKSLTPSNNRISRDVTNNESPKTDMGPSAAELRLPRSLNPLSYDLTIQTYLPGYVDIPKEKNLTFDGQVTINLVTLTSLRKLVFNAKNLKINETKCNLTVDGQPLGIKSVVLQPQFEKVAFDLEGDIKSGANVELKIGYTGLINSNLGGLYQAAYVSADGTPKIAAVTQMESTDARQMVPCLDEPAYKANWTVTVIHPKGTNAISNGYTLDSKAVNDNFIITTFEPTPKMSSYLLAIIVSDFQSVKASGNHKVEFRVWGTEQGKEYLTYAAEMGQKCLEFYEDYFKIPFPLKKMDMVALPDFAAGAMENWGLITYRETSLLYNPALWPPQQKRRVAVVIAHELAHQWFGNLVTMKWWDDLWLNEGFATYVEYIGTNHISDGNFRMNEYFIERALNTAFDADNQASSHPLSFKIDKAFEVAEAFDSISYEKGGSILQMIKHVMTEEKFNDGIYEYLNAHSYGNAEASDLWVALNNHSTVKGPGGTQLDIPQFASQWTVQMGYPYLTAEQYNETAVKVYQTRYKLNQAAHEKEKYANPIYKFKWDVPIWYQVGGNPTKMTWLPRDGEIFIDVGKDKMDEALILNAESRAFYRQNYDYDGWMKVIKQLKTDHTVFSNVTRYAIISDAFAMAAIEKINYTMLFDLLDYMKNESEYLPITAFINGMTEISKHFGTDPEIKFFEDYMSKMVHIDKFTDTYNSIAHNYLDDVKFFENVKELKIFEFNCDHGSVECNSLLKEKYNQELKTTCKNNELLSKCVKIAAPLRKDVYCAGVKNGDQGEFERMMNYYKRETVQLEQSNILQALACSQDPVTLKSLISTTIDRTSNVIRFQDASSVFQYIAKNNIGSEFIFKSFIQRWEDIYKSFKSDIGIVGKIISSCVGSIRTSQELNQLIQFRDTAPHASEFNAFTKNIEKIQNTIEWINKNYKTVTKLLQERI